MKTKTPDQDFSESLTQLRTASGMSQKELAETVGVSPSIICRLEKDEAKVELGLFVRICNALDVYPSQLISPTFFKQYDEGSKQQEMYLRAKREVLSAVESFVEEAIA